jgi:hypothetical protein
MQLVTETARFWGVSVTDDLTLSKIAIFADIPTKLK